MWKRKLETSCRYKKDRSPSSGFPARVERPSRRNSHTLHRRRASWQRGRDCGRRRRDSLVASGCTDASRRRARRKMRTVGPHTHTHVKDAHALATALVRYHAEATFVFPARMLPTKNYPKVRSSSRAENRRRYRIQHASGATTPGKRRKNAQLHRGPWQGRFFVLLCCSSLMRPHRKQSGNTANEAVGHPLTRHHPPSEISQETQLCKKSGKQTIPPRNERTVRGESLLALTHEQAKRRRLTPPLEEPQVTGHATRGKNKQTTGRGGGEGLETLGGRGAVENRATPPASRLASHAEKRRQDTLRERPEKSGSRPLRKGTPPTCTGNQRLRTGVACSEHELNIAEHFPAKCCAHDVRHVPADIVICEPRSGYRKIGDEIKKLTVNESTYPSYPSTIFFPRGCGENFQTWPSCACRSKTVR